MAHAPSRYELLDRIAVGGMAEVYRAKAFGAHGFEKTLAIKRILPELAKDPEFEERFIAEAKLAVDLSHANVVQVLDFGRFAGTLFIAMELVSGLDLAALLKFYSSQEERVSIPAAFQIAIEIVRGLSFAHQNNVVHRDVSPSNILLSKAGEVKIADFGIATAIQSKVAKDEGRIMGKWRYMSPEQTHGAQLTEHSDLFSAAVVIYEIFSGEKLFPGDDSKAIIENIHCMEIPSLAELRPGVPPALDEVLGHALERSLDKRINSGADFLRALTEASYKSSIVATSIDVADAVAAAAAAGVEGTSVKPKVQAEVDDLIRAQLAGVNQFRAADRRTAVAEFGEDLGAESDVGHAVTQLDEDGGTMVRRGVDKAGVTIWELDQETVAAVPSAKRKAEADTGKVEAMPAKGRYQEEERGHPGLRRGVIYSAIAFSSLIGLMIFFVGRGPSHSGAGAPVEVGDARPVVALKPAAEQVLTIDSTPRGAVVLINNVALEGQTPLEHRVPADTPISVVLRLKGYEEHTEEFTLKEGQSQRMSPALKAFVASLTVLTTPIGATVVLDGQVLGLTPFLSESLKPGVGHKLEIRLKDHKTFETTIDLVRNEPTKINRTLKNLVAYGKVRIHVRRSWADVYEGTKRVGDTTSAFPLRAGVHKLRLVNPKSGNQKTITLVVTANRVTTKTTSYDP